MVTATSLTRRGAARGAPWHDVREPGRASAARRRGGVATRTAHRTGWSFRSLVSLPFIYSATVPLVLLDAWLTAYQWICFPLYRIARVRRSPYFVFDRHRLAYLTLVERAHCAYCSYANGVLAYSREIAARTEQYWCPIKHGRPIRGTHRRYASFFGHGDADGYRNGLLPMRARLRPRGSRRRVRSHAIHIPVRFERHIFRTRGRELQGGSGVDEH